MGQVSVRAKFRVLGVRAGWDQSHVLEAAPIMPRTKTWPQEENSVENTVFWDATPTGRAELTFRKQEPPWQPNEAIYIDLEHDEGNEGGWVLWKIGLMETSLEVCFYPCGTDLPSGCISAHLEMTINNRDAWPPFKEAGPGSKWKVVFSGAKA